MLFTHIHLLFYCVVFLNNQRRHPEVIVLAVLLTMTILILSLNSLGCYQGSDYVSGARTNYHNSMCPASGYVTARKNCCKPICPAPGKIGGSNCVRHIICAASVRHPKNMSQ